MCITIMQLSTTRVFIVNELGCSQLIWHLTTSLSRFPLCSRLHVPAGWDWYGWNWTPYNRQSTVAIQCRSFSTTAMHSKNGPGKPATNTQSIRWGWSQCICPTNDCTCRIKSPAIVLTKCSKSSKIDIHSRTFCSQCNLPFSILSWQRRPIKNESIAAISILLYVCIG